MGLMDILSGGMNLLDLPASMIRDTLGGANPFDQLASPFQYENRLDGRDVLENWGLLGQNQEGFDLGDVAGFAADVVMDPFTLGALGRKIAGVGTKAAAKAFGKNVATDAAVFAPIMAGAYGINPQTQWSLPMMASAYGINPQTQWSLPGAAGAGDAVNAAIGLPRAIQGPMTPWAAMGHNRKVQQMLDAGAMPADVARQTRAKVVDPSLYDHLTGSVDGSQDFETFQKMRSDWIGGAGVADEYDPSAFIPAELYHGTASDYFTDIDIGLTDPGNLAGRGFYMTNNPVVADSYVNKGRPWAMERRRMSPSLVRSKLQDFMQANPGIAIDESVPVGNTLARFLSGDLALDEFQARAMAGRMFGEPAYGNISDIERMFDMTPVKPDQGWLKVSDSSDPLAVHSAKSDMENLFKDSVEVITPSGYHVQKRMLDTRNPFDLDAVVENPDGLGPEMLLEDVSQRLGLNHKYTATSQEELLNAVVDEIWNQRLTDHVNVGGYRVNPSIVPKTRDGLKEMIETIVSSDDPSGWASKKFAEITKSTRAKYTPELLRSMDGLSTHSAINTAVGNLKKVIKAQDTVRQRGYVSGPNILNGVIFDEEVLKGTKEVLHWARGLYRGMEPSIDDVKQIMNSVNRGSRNASNIVESALARGMDGYEILDQLQSITKTLPEPEQYQAMANFLETKGIDGQLAESLGDYIGVYNGFNQFVGYPDIRIQDMIRGASAALDPTGALQAGENILDEFAQSVLVSAQKGSYTAQRAMGPINLALSKMRGDDLVGWDVFNYLKKVDPDETHTLFGNLGYDALTHTGGQRSGNGDLLHRVFVGLDPDKIYKGHSIAPDPVDVWTLQNVLTGMPAMSVPTRAMWAESRSAPGM